MRCTFEAVTEDLPGPRWQRLFARHWPAYRGWYLRAGVTERPTYLECRRALREHLPKWVPVWEQLVELAGGGDVQARFLSLWSPPAYIAGCSQAVWQGPSGPLLVRNYDYAPALLEGTWLASRWTQQRVVAMSDCLCGALDGINESGLAVSLSFGGRKQVGSGFGIPIVLRYLLEFCATTREATRELQRIPVHMTYSVTLLDRTGDAATVFVAPDRPAEVLTMRPLTNHQHAVEWLEHAKATESVERVCALESALQQAGHAEDVIDAMLSPPLFQYGYDKGYGTLYTAIYDPTALMVEMAWPMRRWRQSVSGFREGSYRARFPQQALAPPGDG